MIDLRNFKYPLNPLLKKAEWNLDRLQLELLSKRNEYDHFSQQLKELENDFVQKMETITSAWNTSLNIVMHQNSLHYLMDAKNQINKKKENLAELKAVVEISLKRCVDQQLKIELLKNHKKEQRDAFIVEQLNVMNAEVDRDWNARSFWNTQKIKGPM